MMPQKPKKPAPAPAEDLEDDVDEKPEIDDPNDPDRVRDRFEGRFFRDPGDSGWLGPDE